MPPSLLPPSLRPPFLLPLLQPLSSQPLPIRQNWADALKPKLSGMDLGFFVCQIYWSIIEQLSVLHTEKLFLGILKVRIENGLTDWTVVYGTHRCPILRLLKCFWRCCNVELTILSRKRWACLLKSIGIFSSTWVVRVWKSELPDLCVRSCWLYNIEAKLLGACCGIGFRRGGINIIENMRESCH